MKFRGYDPSQRLYQRDGELRRPLRGANKHNLQPAGPLQSSENNRRHNCAPPASLKDQQEWPQDLKSDAESKLASLASRGKRKWTHDQGVETVNCSAYPLGGQRNLIEVNKEQALESLPARLPFQKQAYKNQESRTPAQPSAAFAASSGTGKEETHCFFKPCIHLVKALVNCQVTNYSFVSC